MLPHQRKIQCLVWLRWVLSTVALVPHAPGCTAGQTYICFETSLYSSVFENVKHLSSAPEKARKTAVPVPQLSRRHWLCTHITSNIAKYWPHVAVQLSRIFCKRLLYLLWQQKLSRWITTWWNSMRFFMKSQDS